MQHLENSLLLHFLRLAGFPLMTNVPLMPEKRPEVGVAAFTILYNDSIQ